MFQVYGVQIVKRVMDLRLLKAQQTYGLDNDNPLPLQICYWFLSTPSISELTVQLSNSLSYQMDHWLSSTLLVDCQYRLVLFPLHLQLVLTYILVCYILKYKNYHSKIMTVLLQLSQEYETQSILPQDYMPSESQQQPD